MMYCGEVFKLFLWVGFLASTAFAQWPRYIHALKSFDDVRDSPPSHPLAYFTVDPCARPASDRLCGAMDMTYPGAPPPDASEMERRAKTHTSLRLVGKVGALTVYDLEYFLGGNDYVEGPHARSVLVENAQNQFHEILAQQQTAALDKFDPSALLDVGQQEVLETGYVGRGHPGYRLEDYFTFTESRSQRLDFKPIYEAAAKVVPPNMDLIRIAEAVDFHTLSWTIPAEPFDARTNPAHSRGGGRISVTFRLENGQVIPTGATYEPNSR